MIVGLAACGQSTTPAATTGTAPTILGFAAITFNDVNTDHMTVTATTSSLEDGIGGLKAQVLSRPAQVSVVQGTSRGAYQDGARRYMYATLDVTNNSGAAYKNVTLLGFNIPGYSLYDTALSTATHQNGSTVTKSESHTVVPVNARLEDPNTGLAVIPNLKADFQLYSESYVQNITDFFNAPTRFTSGPNQNAGAGATCTLTQYGYSTALPGCATTGDATAFPFGFVARSSTNKIGSRSIVPGSKTGQMTVAFAADDSTPLDDSDDVRSFTFVGLITADAVTTTSADKYEASLDRACSAVLAFGGTTVHGFNGQTGGAGCTVATVPSLRIAGDDAAGSITTQISYP